VRTRSPDTLELAKATKDRRLLFISSASSLHPWYFEAKMFIWYVYLQAYPTSVQQTLINLYLLQYKYEGRKIHPTCQVAYFIGRPMYHTLKMHKWCRSKRKHTLVYLWLTLSTSSYQDAQLHTNRSSMCYYSDALQCRWLHSSCLHILYSPIQADWRPVHTSNTVEATLLNAIELNVLSTNRQ